MTATEPLGCGRDSAREKPSVRARHCRSRKALRKAGLIAAVWGRALISKGPMRGLSGHGG